MLVTDDSDQEMEDAQRSPQFSSEYRPRDGSDEDWSAEESASIIAERIRRQALQSRNFRQTGQNPAIEPEPRLFSS